MCSNDVMWRGDNSRFCKINQVQPPTFEAPSLNSARTCNVANLCPIHTAWDFTDLVFLGAFPKNYLFAKNRVTDTDWLTACASMYANNFACQSRTRRVVVL